MVKNTDQVLPPRHLFTSAPDNFLAPSMPKDRAEIPKQYMANQYLPSYGMYCSPSFPKQGFVSPTTLLNTNSNPMLLEKGPLFLQPASKFTNATSFPQQEFRVYSQIPVLHRNNSINESFNVSRSNSANMNYLFSSPENRTNSFQSSTTQSLPLKNENIPQQSTQSSYGTVHPLRTMLINDELYINRNDLSNIVPQLPLYPVISHSQWCKQQQNFGLDESLTAKVKAQGTNKNEEETAEVKNAKNTLTGKVKKVPKQWAYKNSKHVCKLCKKPFPSESTLITHENIHLNLKPFECSICGKKFNAKQNWKRHELVVHKQK